MVNIYARTIGAMTEAYVASTRMATNVLFAGIDATRATTNYARQNAKEASSITSNTARIISNSLYTIWRFLHYHFWIHKR